MSEVTQLRGNQVERNTKTSSAAVTISMLSARLATP